MATDGIEGLHIETRNYGATAAFWRSLGFESTFETDHGSGHWVHPAGGPYVFITERHDGELRVQPVVAVSDPGSFTSSPPVEVVQPFTPQHWGALEAIVCDPDGRQVSLQAPGERR